MAFAADKIRQGAAGTGDFTIDQSLRFDNTVYPNNSNLSYLSKTPSAASNRRTFTWSIWLKRGRVDSDSTFVYAGPSNNDAFRMQIDGSDNIVCYDYQGSGNYFEWKLATTAKYRDHSAWYHIVLEVDTTKGTNTNRVK